jgi:hypothetical protein
LKFAGSAEEPQQILQLTAAAHQWAVEIRPRATRHPTKGTSLHPAPVLMAPALALII